MDFGDGAGLANQVSDFDLKFSADVRVA
jgi:hypothetical protein